MFEQLGSASRDRAASSTTSCAPALIAAGAPSSVVLAERFVRGRVDRGRLAAVVAMALAYWAALALYRPWVAEQEPSRFLYGGACWCSLARSRWPAACASGPRALAVVGVLVVLSAVSNLDDLRDGAPPLRAYSDYVEPGLGALELTRGHVSAGLPPRAHARARTSWPAGTSRPWTAGGRRPTPRRRSCREPPGRARPPTSSWWGRSG